MTHADMAEAIQHAFIGQGTIGARNLVTGLIKRLRHWAFLFQSVSFLNATSKAIRPPLPSHSGYVATNLKRRVCPQ
jgi:hypothetical protein